LADRRFPAYALYWGADYPDPESMIEMLFGSASPDNYTGYANADLDALLELARNGAPVERIGLFEQANQLLIDDVALIPMYHPTGHTLTREGMGGVVVTPMGIIGLETIQDVI
jgi:ABC-type oligopeptide transport system substrate-binding subunit